MKTKMVVTLLALTSLLAVTAVMKSVPQTNKQNQTHIAKLQDKEKKGSINITEASQLAKARGEQRIVIPSLITLHLGMPNNPVELEETLPEHTVVVAELVDKKSYMPSQAVIRTWNKLVIQEILSQAPYKPIPFQWPAVPEELLPVQENEFLVHTEGGSVTVDGVEVVQGDADVKAFRKSQKYLLVISLNPETKIGRLELGPQSYIPINEDQSLNASEDKHLLQQILKEKYGGSIKQLKDKIKSR